MATAASVTSDVLSKMKLLERQWRRMEPLERMSVLYYSSNVRPTSSTSTHIRQYLKSHRIDQKDLENIYIRYYMKKVLALPNKAQRVFIKKITRSVRNPDDPPRPQTFSSREILEKTKPSTDNDDEEPEDEDDDDDDDWTTVPDSTNDYQDIDDDDDEESDATSETEATTPTDDGSRTPMTTDDDTLDDTDRVLLGHLLDAVEHEVAGQQVNMDAQVQADPVQNMDVGTQIFGITEHGSRAGLELANRIGIDAMRQRLSENHRQTFRGKTRKLKTGSPPFNSDQMATLLTQASDDRSAPPFLANVNKIINTPLSGSQLLSLCHTLGISDLVAISDDRVINPVPRTAGQRWTYCLALVFPTEGDTGHWVCFHREPNRKSTLFTSYGLDWRRNRYYQVTFTPQTRQLLGEIREPHKGFCYQSLDSDTCGLWCVLWAFCKEHGILKSHLPLGKALDGVTAIKYDPNGFIPKDPKSSKRAKANDTFLARTFASYYAILGR